MTAAQWNTILSSTSLKRSRFSHEDYKIACIVALDVELAALQAMLDTKHDDLPSNRDFNAYTLGEISGHNVVIATLSSTGLNDSGAAANQLLHDFPCVRFGVLVGVGGGIPGADGHNDIRLGDVVVSEPSGTTGGVLQFDRGKNHAGDCFERTGHLNKPPPILNATVKNLKAKHRQRGTQTVQFVDDMIRRQPFMKQQYSRPDARHDNLYESSYDHVSGITCQNCDSNWIIERSLRLDNAPKIYYGTIGSSNSLLRNAVERDRLGKEYNILSVEMEAAGIMDTLPCLVVRGICDYADSHKNKIWQPYASAVAAAYVRELLQELVLDSSQLSTDDKSQHTLPSSLSQDTTCVQDDGISNKAESEKTLYESLSEALTFERMDDRRRNIAEALPHTCRWLFDHEKFITWAREPGGDNASGFFWIKGKPGCGKSTMMKTVLRWAEKTWPDDINVSYFFNARAPGLLEKSSLGFYQSLTHSILQKYGHLQDLFLAEFRHKAKKGVVEGWTTQELQNFLVGSVRDLRFARLNIFVDALDEGDEDDIRQMITFLEDLNLCVPSTSPGLRICLSSRHFPHISIQQGLSLVMEDEAGHEHDIRRFIRIKLVGGKSSEMVTLRDEVFTKSARIFLWVVLVIPILNKAYDRGRSISDMSVRLEEIPKELDDLFATILDQSAEDISECVSLLQWVLFSSRALSPVELNLALNSTLNSSEYGIEDVSLDRLQRHFLNTSRGLIEITKSKNPVVQFIHETVRDFLKRRGLAFLDAKLASNLEGLSHEKLKMGCLQYVAAHRPSEVSNVSDSGAKRQRIKADYLRTAPFIDYAVNNLWEHADAAECYSLSQQHVSNVVLDANGGMLDLWIRARNNLQSMVVRRYSPNAQLLYIAAERNLPNLAQACLRTGVQVNAECERYGSALQAAAVVGSERITRLLLDANASVNIEGGEYRHALVAAILSKNESVARLLVERGAKPKQDVLESCLFKVIARGYLNGIELLLDLGARTNCRNHRKETPLIAAVIKRRHEVIKLLVERGADVENYRLDDNALYRACKLGEADTVCLLIQKGVDVNGQGNNYGQILQVACTFGHGEIVQILIEKGADVRAQGGPHGSALYAASVCGHEHIVRLLLEHGADVDSQGRLCGTALQAACAFGHERIVRLLIEMGADIHAQEENYVNIFQAACERGHERVARLLIKMGAGIHPHGGCYGNPLQEACVYGNIQVVRLLLEQGVDVNAKGGIHSTSLHAACEHKQARVVRLLLKHGADRNARNKDGRTPGQVAVRDSRWDIVQLIDAYDL